MALLIATTMITTSTDSYGTNYCVECADNQPAIREKIEQALLQERLVIGEPAGSEICEGCGRHIRDVAAYRRTYRVKPTLTITTTLEIPARSAIEALLILDDAIDADAITDGVQEKMEPLLEKGKIVESELSYEVNEPQIMPPPDFRSLAPSLGIATTPVPPPQPTSAIIVHSSCAQIEALIVLYRETALRETYMSNQAACTVLHFLLTRNDLQPRFFQGYLINHTKGRAHPHTWLEIMTQEGPRIIDQGENLLGEEIPSGLFAIGSIPHLVYSGNSTFLPPLPPMLQKDVLTAIEQAHVGQTARPEQEDC